MKKSAYMSIMTAVMLIVGCSRVGTDDSRPVIMMSANVVEHAVVTKAVAEADAYTDTVPSLDRPLAADLWFSMGSGLYGTEDATDYKTYIPCHTQVKFDTGDPVVVLYEGKADQALKYPTDSTVYCMGFYPQSAWSYAGSDGVIAKAEITGSQDLMFAPEIHGEWNEKFESQQFKHVLTWLKIVACATSHDAVDAWGKITRITVSSKQEVLLKSVDGSSLEYLTDGTVTAFEDESGIEDEFGKGLDIVFDDEDGVHGSVFVSPADNVTVTVTTEDGKTAEKTISVAGGFAAGKQYVLALYFDPLAIIDGMCTLTSWENENDNLYIN